MTSRASFILLIVLIAGAGLLVWVIDPWTTTGGGLEEMLPGDPGKVRRVSVISGSDTLVMIRRDSTWQLDGEVLNQDAVENLLFAASHLSLKSIIPGETIDSIKVFAELFFHGSSKETGHFTIARHGQGYVIFSPGEADSYGVEVPGYEELSLEKVFSANPDHYRRHLLMDLLPSEIRSVEVRPVDGGAFLAEQDSMYNIWVTEVPSGDDITGRIDEQRVRLLFSYFNAIRYEEVVQSSGAIGSVDKGLLLAEVQVRSFDGRKWKFDIFPRRMKGEGTDLFRALVIYNDQPSVLSVNYYYLDLIMRGVEAYW